MTKHLSIIWTILASSCLTFNQEPMPDKIVILANKKILQAYIDSHPDLKKPTIPATTYFVSKDIQILKDIINNIPKLGSDFDEYVKILPGLEVKNNDGFDAGFGLSVASDIMYGDYGNFKLDVLHCQKSVLCVTINMQFSGKGHEFIRDEIIEHVGFPIECSASGIFYSNKFANNIKQYQEENTPLRFKPTQNTYTKQELEYYSILSNPTASLMWGRKCGYSNAPPHGRIEMDKLVDAKKYNLVEDILYSPNVVGRIYALQALESWDSQKEYRLTPQTKQFIEKIKNLETEFEVCDGGCMFVKMTYKKLEISRSKK